MASGQGLGPLFFGGATIYVFHQPIITNNDDSCSYNHNSESQSTVSNRALQAHRSQSNRDRAPAAAAVATAVVASAATAAAMPPPIQLYLALCRQLCPSRPVSEAVTARWLPLFLRARCGRGSHYHRRQHLRAVMWTLFVCCVGTAVTGACSTAAAGTPFFQLKS